MQLARATAKAGVTPKMSNGRAVVVLVPVTAVSKRIST